MEYIKRVPFIEKNDRTVHEAKCVCGGTMRAWRAEEDNGHMKSKV